MVTLLFSLDLGIGAVEVEFYLLAGNGDGNLDLDVGPRQPVIIDHILEPVYAIIQFGDSGSGPPGHGIDDRIAALGNPVFTPFIDQGVASAQPQLV